MIYLFFLESTNLRVVWFIHLLVGSFKVSNMCLSFSLPIMFTQIIMILIEGLSFLSKLPIHFASVFIIVVPTTILIREWFWVFFFPNSTTYSLELIYTPRSTIEALLFCLVVISVQPSKEWSLSITIRHLSLVLIIEKITSKGNKGSFLRIWTWT